MVEKNLQDDAPSRQERFETHVRLAAACERGDLDEVRHILGDMPELARQDALSNDEHQPLHYAVYGNQLEVALHLLAQGANPLRGIYPHREATTARALAFDRGHTEIVDAIDAHLEVTRGASDAGRDLCAAAGAGDAEAVLAALDGDSTLIESRDNEGFTPLLCAIRGGHISIVRQLLERGADVEASGAAARPLRIALHHSWKTPDEDYPTYTAIAGMLVGCGAHIDLWAAAGLGDIDATRRCLAAGDPVNPEGGGSHAPLTIASFRGHVDVVVALLEAGADPDAARQIDVAGEPFQEKGEPIWLAANRGHINVVRALLDGGATAAGTIYASGTPIEQALLHGHREIADLLFLHGGEGHPLALCVVDNIPALVEHLRAHTGERERLLWSALLAGNERVLEYELSRGVEVPYEEQHNLLAQAIRGWRLGNLKICNDGWDRRSTIRNLQRLVDAGFDVNVRNHRSTRADYTILHHLAARSCNPSVYGHTDEEVVEFARILIDGGAEVDALESQLHSTPLGWAARYGQIALCRFLLTRGANPNEGYEPWARPLAWAERYGHQEVADLLREAGATT